MKSDIKFFSDKLLGQYTKNNVIELEMQWFCNGIFSNLNDFIFYKVMKAGVADAVMYFP